MPASYRKPMILTVMVGGGVVGQKFRSKDWPLHITLVPWFNVDDTVLFEEKLQALLVHTNPFDVTVGEHAVFGNPARPKDVQLIQPSIELLQLHDRLLELVRIHGYIERSLSYVGKGYRPHISAYGNRTAQPGDLVKINNVWLTEETAFGWRTPVRQWSLA